MAIKTWTSERVTSADINTYLTNAGLVYVTETTASAVASKLVTGITSTYENYRLVVTNLTCTAGTLIAQLSLNGTTSGASYYGGFRGYTYAGADANASVNNGVWWTLAAPSATIPGTLVMDIMRPNIAGASAMTATHVGGISAISGGGLHNVATAYNEVYFGLFGGGTLSGTFRLYGYRQA